MKRMTVFLLAILLAIPVLSPAVTVTNLYEAEVPVKDQSAGTRNSAIHAALVQVMVKLTGNRNASSIYGVAELLERAQQFVQQYEYRSGEDQLTGKPTTRLWVRFDASVIDNGMREFSIPVWSQERPSTLVWLVIKDDLGQRFASLDENSRYFSVLYEQARARGISFITPLYDLDDAASINTSDVVGGFDGPVLLASERYQPDAILAGVVTTQGQGLWEGNWLGIIQGQPIRWSNSSDSIDIVLSEGMDGMADHLAARFAQLQGFVSENIQEISVTGVNSFAQYARTLSYLESLNIVSSVDVKRMESGRVIYVLSTRGSTDSLIQALALGRVLQSSGPGGEFLLLQ